MSSEQLRECLSCCKDGLQALGSDSKRVTIKSKILLSADIDSHFKKAYPSDNRWDYLVAVQKGRDESAAYIEVHPATTSEVRAVLKKKEWLRERLQQELSCMKDVPSKYYWVATGGVKIPSHTPQFKKLAQSGISGPLKHLSLSQT